MFLLAVSKEGIVDLAGDSEGREIVRRALFFVESGANLATAGKVRM
jgi:hypothetical protein